MDPIRRLISYATMYVDMDMFPNFLKLWYNFFNKVNSVENINMMSLDKHVNTCRISRFSRGNRTLLHASLFWC